MANPKPTIEQIMEAVENGDGTGFCTACHSEQSGCEPDMRKGECESCGLHAVYGAEELLLLTL